MFGHNILISIALIACWGSFVVDEVDAGLGADEKAAMMKELFPLYLKCIKGPPLTPEQVRDLKKNDFDTYACYYGCFLKNVGVMDDNNMLNADKISEVSRRYIKDPDMLGKLDNVSKECSKVNAIEVKDGDKTCGKAKLVLDCVAKQKNISIFTD